MKKLGPTQRNTRKGFHKHLLQEIIVTITFQAKRFNTLVELMNFLLCKVTQNFSARKQDRRECISKSARRNQSTQNQELHPQRPCHGQHSLIGRDLRVGFLSSTCDRYCTEYHPLASSRSSCYVFTLFFFTRGYIYEFW